MTNRFEETFVQEHAGIVARYRRMANRAMVQYIVVRLGLVIGSAALPALTTLDDRSWAIGASVLVAIFAGLDTQFQWGEEWRHFRSTQLTLERLYRRFLRQQDLIGASTDTTGTIDRNARNFDSFYNDTESLLDTESEKFWRFRITAWKGRSSPA